jgi:hypothetical protein
MRAGMGPNERDLEREADDIKDTDLPEPPAQEGGTSSAVARLLGRRRLVWQSQQLTFRLLQRSADLFVAHGFDFLC